MDDVVKTLTVVISEEERDSGGPINVDHDLSGVRVEGLEWKKGKMNASIDPTAELPRGASIRFQLETSEERAERRARLVNEAIRVYKQVTKVSWRRCLFSLGNRS